MSASTETISPDAKPECIQANNFTPLTAKMAWQLAAPHTWPASIIPVLIAVSAAYACEGVLLLPMSFTLLIICALMQSSVNTLNDYFDYVKGTDSADDNVEASDAVLVYNNVNPKSALGLAIAFLACAFLLGIYPIMVAGYIPLIFALIGALIVALYSGGKTPISYLPIGEFVSGFVMGGLIVVASYYVLTKSLPLAAWIWAIPTTIGVALIMFTNNTCDIEKDIEAKRNTLSVKIGRERARAVYHALIVLWIAFILIIELLWFSEGLIIAPFMLLAAYPFINALWKNPLAPPSRIAAMSQICSVNVILGSFYALGIILGV